MTDAGHEDTANREKEASFVQSALGPWSSHPDMLPRQRRIFRLIGYLPLVFGVLVAVLVLTSYRLSDFANVHDVATLCVAIGKLLVRCGWALVALLCALCVTWGFSVTSNMLWGASRRISLTPAKEVSDRDAMPIPTSVLAAGILFWLVPIVLPLFKPVLTAIDGRLYWLLLILSNICCFLPFVLLRLWIATGDDTGNRGRSGWRHPYRYLCAWLLFLALAVIVVSLPDLPPLTQFVDSAFAAYVNRNCPWILKVLNTTTAGLFRICRFVIAVYFAWKSLVYFLKWRLKWVPEKNSGKGRKDEASQATGETGDDGAGGGAKEIPGPAKSLIETPPEGVSLEGEVEMRSPDQCVSADNGADPLGLRFLIDLQEGNSPTKDQRNFFDRFVSSYEEARNGFLENEDPRIPPKQADLILHGADGSGRTTILLASALYAAVVRGQRVLYFVSSRSDAERLAGRVNAHLHNAMVDCYFSAGVLKPTDVDDWLATYSLRPDENRAFSLSGKESLPPDILFATPEAVERCFFSNAMTLDAETREAMRRMLVGFSLFVVDDFLDYPVAVRSHLAFIVDKFRLLLATEFVVPQFVVATSPLEASASVDMLGQRLFGFNRFNRSQNVYEIHPRTVAPYPCATIVVNHGTPLSAAVQSLLRDSLQKNVRTLLYHRGISAAERAKTEEEFKDAVMEGRLKVVGRLGELDGRESYDHVFFVSDACGDAAAALRLNMADDGAPVFFRIKKKGESDSADKGMIVLLPDETAVSLRAFHLRSVLQYIPRLTPVEASVWSNFGIYKDHPNVKDISGLDEREAHVDVQWYQDDLTDDERYAEGQIWAYLVLVTNAAIGTQGRLIDFNVLPNIFESVWADKLSDESSEKRLLLVRDDENGMSRQMVSWRDSKNGRIGETDLAHSEELVYRRRGADQTDDDEYVFGGVPPQDDGEMDPGRFAMAVTARYRRGSEEDFLFPLRRLSWSIPTRDMEVVDLNRLNGLAQFKIRLKGDVSYRVDGVLSGLLNSKGQELEFYPHREFGYDAYMTCIVLDPAFRRLKASSLPEDYVRKCMSGTWATNTKEGFSPALTHALTAALRRRFPGWSFFAVAPTFYIEGREDSVGKAVVWLVEPANSGRTAEPVLKALFEDDAFWSDVIGHAHAVLEECGDLLWQLRMRSRLAFSDEAVSDDDIAKAKAILESVEEKRKSDQSNADDGEDEKGAEDEDDSEDNDDDNEESEARKPRRSSDNFTDDEKQFEKVVLDSLDNFEDMIDLTNTDFVVAHDKDPNAIMELFNDILWNHPDIFYISKNARYQYWTSPDGKVVKFVVRDIPYGFTKAQLPQAKARLDSAVEEAMKTIDDAMSAVEKAKALHDYIVKVCEYDTVARDTHDTSPAARTVYSVLVRHLAVCEGYTMAYRYLLNQIGVNSEEVISDAMNHCWNYLQLGENWYHVDVTWDDPIYQGRKPDNNRISHEHFLLSDKAIRAKEHYDWDVRGLPPATDTMYDGRDWDDETKRQNGNAADHNRKDIQDDESERKQRERRERNETVSWENYRNHPLFRAKGSGNVKDCRGKIHVRVFFVDDGKCSWTDKMRAAYRTVVNDSLQILKHESGLGSELEVAWSEENLKMAGTFSKGNEAHDVVPALLGVSGTAGISKIQNAFRKAHKVGEVPMMFIWAWDFRGSANQSHHDPSARRSGEWATIGVRNLIKDPEWAKHTFLHELLHLFGAEDYYYPPQITAAAEKWLAGSIMNGGMVIDDLTRVLIGWDSMLTASAEEFLKATSGVTAKEIDDACKAEGEKKWP